MPAGFRAGRDGRATAINTKGQIVGALGASPDAAGEELAFSSPFLYQREVMTSLPHFDLMSSAAAISPLGVVVGNGEDTRSEEVTENAWVWENGTVQSLPELVAGHVFASGINGAGNIVGRLSTASGPSHAVLWRRR
jgi:uncharacterized membrane protein